MNGSPEEIPCTWKDEAICEDCELKGELLCRYSKEAVVCFRRRHFGFRAISFLVTVVASWLTGLWIMLIIYAAVTILNFAFIETYYLCRHCPFYAKEGRTLKCITLEGIPRIWKYNPAPSRIAKMKIRSHLMKTKEKPKIVLAGHGFFVCVGWGIFVLLNFRFWRDDEPCDEVG